MTALIQVKDVTKKYGGLIANNAISFDVSVWECFWPLISGCRLVLAGPGEHRDPHRIAQLVQTYGVTTLHPALFAERAP